MRRSYSLALVVTVLAACGGGGGGDTGAGPSGPSTPTTPSQPATSTVPATVAAQSSAQQSGVVGSAAAARPSVIVRNAAGQPLANVAVTFAVTSGGGSIAGASATTGADGVATVGNWTLGTVAGTNTATATVGSLPAVTFSATAAAGSAAQLTKVAGDNQTAQPGDAVPTGPSVRLTDVYGNPVVGGIVTFDVGSGGGSLVSPLQTTSSTGIATVGSWRLGSAYGVPVSNTLTARATGVPAVTFSASLPASCTASARLAAFSSISATLSPSDCLVNGRPTQFYQTTVSAAAPLSYSASLVTEGVVTLLSASGSPLASSELSGTATKTPSVRVLTPTGNYIVAVSTASSGLAGAAPYTLTNANAPGDVGGCALVFVIPGIIAGNQVIQSTDCVASGFYSDRYTVYLRAGQQLSAEDFLLDGEAYPLLNLFGQDGSLVARGTNGDVNAFSTLTYSSIRDGFYVLEAGTTHARTTGTYRLTVK